MDESDLRTEESGSRRRSLRIKISRDLNCKSTSQKEASKRKPGAKDVGDQISLDCKSKRKLEEIGGGSKSKKRSEKGSSRHCMKSRVLRDSNSNKVLPRPAITNSAEKVRARAGSTWLPNDPDAIEKHYRSFRESSVEMFNADYVYGATKSDDQEGRNCCDPTTLIWPGGSSSWMVASSGITWVAVQGKDSICVVTKNQDVDKDRLRSFLMFRPKEQIRLRFMKTVVHEMEDPSSDLRQRLRRFGQGVKMRSFAAVSMARDTGEMHEGRGHEDSEAFRFLAKELKNDPAFSYEETVQTAISALQYVHGEEFQPTDILVEILMKGKQSETYLGSDDIKKHLAVICQQV